MLQAAPKVPSKVSAFSDWLPRGVAGRSGPARKSAFTYGKWRNAVAGTSAAEALTLLGSRTRAQNSGKRVDASGMHSENDANCHSQ